MVSVTESVWQITAPHYCAGLVTSNGRVIDAAPIIKWSIGRPWAEVKTYLAGKGYHGVPA